MGFSRLPICGTILLYPAKPCFCQVRNLAKAMETSDAGEMEVFYEEMNAVDDDLSAKISSEKTLFEHVMENHGLEDRKENGNNWVS